VRIKNKNGTHAGVRTQHPQEPNDKINSPTELHVQLNLTFVYIVEERISESQTRYPKHSKVSHPTHLHILIKCEKNSQWYTSICSRIYYFL